MSSNGKDGPGCGTACQPCKSLKYISQTPELSRGNIIRIVHVKGKFLTCENVRVQKSMQLVGINGTPVFNCSHSCRRFLEIEIQLPDTQSNTREPALMIQNIELINKGCKTSPIAILKAPSVLFNNISVKESTAPAIVIHPPSELVILPHGYSLKVIFRRSAFLSASGIKLHKSIELTIDSCLFDGSGAKIPLAGIEVTGATDQKLKLFIISTIFVHLASAISISLFPAFSVRIESCKFEHNHAVRYDRFWSTFPFGGAFLLNHLSPSWDLKPKLRRILFINVTFQNNTSLMGGAAAFFTNGWPRRPGVQIEFKNCLFLANKAITGGAIAVAHRNTEVHTKRSGSQLDILLLRNCIFIDNRATSVIHFNQNIKQISYFISNVQGGALGCFRFNLILIHTTLINNNAEFFGGSIFDDRCISSLWNSTIQIDEKMSIIPVQGQAVYSRGVQVMNNVTIKVEKTFLRSSGDSYIWFTGSGITTRSVVVPHMLRLICNVGNNIDLKTRPTVTKNLRPSMLGSILLFRCLPCPSTFYTLESGSGILSNVTLRQLHNITCLPCPHGADCSESIRSKPDYWGYRSEDMTIHFLPCPAKYCCQGHHCKSYNSCNKNREGKLCGRCRSGFSYGLLSAECVEENKCGNPLIWFIVILGGMGYVLFLMYLPEVAVFVKTSVYCVIEKCLRNSESTGENSYTMAGLIKVIFFFSQIEPLVKLEQSTGTVSRSGHNFIDMTRQAQHVFTAILNFQMSISCPFKGLTAITRTAVIAAFPLVSLLVLALLLILYWTTKFVKMMILKTKSNNTSYAESKFIARLVSCFINLVLLTYGIITKTTLALLSCARINKDRVLYLDGTVTCYKPWQFIVAAFICVFIFPLPFGLALSFRKFKKGKFTVTQFLLRLCLPILAAFEGLKSCIWRRMVRDRDQNHHINPKRVFQMQIQCQEVESESYDHGISGWSISKIVCDDTEQCSEDSKEPLERSPFSWQPQSFTDHSETRPQS